MLLLNYIRIHHPLLLQVVRDGVLRKQWGLQADFSADPFAFVMRGVRSVVAAAAAAELGAEVGALDFVVLADFAPGFIAECAGDVDFESYHGHEVKGVATDLRGLRG